MTELLSKLRAAYGLLDMALDQTDEWYARHANSCYLAAIVLLMITMLIIDKNNL